MYPKFHISTKEEIVDIGHHMREIEKIFGGVRPAARAAGIDVAYWAKLRDGEKVNPGEKVLKSLGLKATRVTFYTRRRVDTKQVS